MKLPSKPTLLRNALFGAAFVVLASLNMGGGCANLNNGNLTNWVGAGQKFVAATSLSEKDEDQMGRAIGINLTSHYGLDPDQRVNTYVNLVGFRLVGVTDRPDGNWVFAVLNTPEVNAMSGPNGYVFITRGLLNQCHDESELAGVLAHEIAHVIHKDVLNTVKSQGVTDAFLQAANTTQKGAQFSQLTNGGMNVLGKGFDRKQETNADDDAVKFVIAAGYDPMGLIHLVQRMQTEPGAKGGTLLSTHPGLEQRAASLQTRLQQLGGAKGGDVCKARFEIYVH